MTVERTFKCELFFKRKEMIRWSFKKWYRGEAAVGILGFDPVKKPIL
jgi:hypothetical protein